ncbi:anthranilate synthase component I family protein [Marinobacter zhanjiangensis]|uniref:Aminodeoxychorismate synthase component I n=1 Tax=Marinobacter zhanjiangensis TaxID=578215 RepID=A0ABQ3BA61_9GAMM|nr:anthranilate synthase component I family protein [Marinobacter zhanjiangensis]GGY82473.1 aminodeoxychorismate synthase component I [Marinobacter zhanjiangensis]
MLTRHTVPRSRVETLLDALAGLDGFICLDTERGDTRRVSALPARHWTFPDHPGRFSGTVSDILQTHQSIAASGAGGAIAGSLFYEAGRQTVPGFRSRQPTMDSLGWAGLYLWDLTIPASGDAWLAFHHLCPAPLKARVLACDQGDKPPVAGAGFRITEPFRALGSAADYQAGVARILSYIQSGDCYQANLSQAFEGCFEGSPWRAWQALTKAIPVPHGGYLDTGHWQLLSVSPELLLEITDKRVTSKPIKGTRPRDQDTLRDQELAEELAASPKDRAENLMIVDLIRNDLSHFCEPFSVRVPQLFGVESFRNVHQLVSTVTGALKADVTPFEAMLSAFPGGSITGAPKRRAMEIIDELEAHTREPYCGSLFWWGADNRLQSNIAIRSLQTLNDGRIRAWAGCGIVADSDPEEEYQESLTKIQRLLTTLETLDQDSGSCPGPAHRA